MTTIDVTTPVDAPPDAVYAVLADAALLPTVSDLTMEVTGDPGRPLQPGDRFEQRIRVLGVALQTEWTVDAAEPGRLVRVDGTGPAGARARIEHRIEPADAGATLRMTVEYDLPAGVLGEAIDHLLVERRSRRDAEAIVANIAELAASRHGRA